MILIYEKIICEFISSIIYLTYMIYVIFQHRTVEISASAMTPENTETIFSTTTNKVIC